jgi:hypothetical protein
MMGTTHNTHAHGGYVRTVIIAALARRSGTTTTITARSIVIAVIGIGVAIHGD